MTGDATLLRIVGSRILAFAGLAMAIQIGLVFADYWTNDEEIAQKLVELETAALLSDVTLVDGRPTVTLDPTRSVRYAPAPDPGASTDTPRPGYYARVLRLDGTLLFTNCGTGCDSWFMPPGLTPPAFWHRALRPGKPLTFVGGRMVATPYGLVHAELAVIEDPDTLIAMVLMHEMIDHMVVPMTLMLTLVMGATIVSLRTALSPVTAAALKAETIDPSSPENRLPVAGMPREVARLARAVNRSLDRIGGLMRAQRLFTSAIGHEVRTPVAIIRLELERIDHPRAAKALKDLDGLTHLVEQISSLARLDAVDPASFRDTDLAALAEDTVGAVAPYVFGSGRSIAFVDEGPARARVVPSLAETVVRNLVDNAVRHTPPGTSVTVTAGPGPTLTVSDDGPGFGAAPEADRAAETEGGIVKRTGSLGIGLRIVERIAALHGARLERGDAGPGVRVTLTFPNAATVAPSLPSGDRAA